MGYQNDTYEPSYLNEPSFWSVINVYEQVCAYMITSVHLTVMIRATLVNTDSFWLVIHG